MLDIRNVKVNFDRSVEPYSFDIGMQHENGIVRLDFEFDEKFNLTNEYLYFMVTDDGRTLVYPIIDNSVVIGSEITQKKRYVANIVVSKNEIIDELNKNYIVWISKDVILTITANSIITGALSPDVLPVQLQIVYDDLFDLKADLINKLESGYFKGDKGDTGEQGPKGDKGDKGDTEVTKENIKTALGENPLIQPSTAQIGQIFKVKSINEDGTLGLEAVDMPSVDDIEGQISELKGDLADFEHEIIDGEYLNLSDGIVIEHMYINEDGVIRNSMPDDCRIIYFNCKNDKIYTISKTLSNAFRVGYTNSIPNHDVALLPYYKNDNTAEELIMGANENAKYLVVYYAYNDTNPNDILNSLKIKSMDFSAKDEMLRNTINVHFERGGLHNGKYRSDKSSFNSNIRTSFFIKTNDAKYIYPIDFNKFKKTLDRYDCIIYKYDENMQYMGYSEYPLNEFNYIKLVNVSYLKIVIQHVDYAEIDLVDVLRFTFIGSIEPPKEIKNIQLSSDSESIMYEVENGIFTTSRLMLPPNYKNEGKQTPIILWLNGSENFQDWDNYQIGGTTYHDFLTYLRDEGFAIFEYFGWGSYYHGKYPNCVNAHPYPTKTCIKALEKGIEFIIDRFNLDENNIHIISKSQGGQMALYLASKPIFKIKSIGMLAPVLDYLSMPGNASYLDTKKAINEEVGFVGNVDYFLSTEFNPYSQEAESFYRENMVQFCSFNESWTNLIGGSLEENMSDSLNFRKKFWTERYWTDDSKTDIYTRKAYAKIANVPVKIWGASDDDQTPYLKMVEVVNQLQNGGTEAYMRNFERGTGGHHSTDTGTNKIDSVTTSLGIVHNNVPIAFKENIDWIRSKMI